MEPRTRLTRRSPCWLSRCRPLTFCRSLRIGQMVARSPVLVVPTAPLGEAPSGADCVSCTEHTALCSQQWEIISNLGRLTTGC